MSTGNDSGKKEQPPTFEDGETVLCYHGPLIYEAKIREHSLFTEKDSRTGYTGMHFLVHYKGWKNTWDEWVQYSRLLKLDSEGLAKQKETLSRHAVPQTASAGPKNPKAGPVVTPSAHASASTRTGRKEVQSRGTKRGREEDEAKKPEMKLTVSEDLKAILIDDWENVTKSAHLIKLRDPKVEVSEGDEDYVPTVAEILDEFTDYVLETKPQNLRNPDTIAPTIKGGLITYFDKALGHMLLYRPERTQYAEVQKQYKTGQHVNIADLIEVSQVYGAPHLLRMLVQLPTIIAGTTLDPESVGIVRDYTNELLVWLSQNKHRFFGAQVYLASSSQQQAVGKT